jgi:tRNA-2-methylthio-N6-dimethylallyladenosine synthase
MRYHIITFGCQMNESDSERIAKNLENKGYKPAPDMAKADLVVVNMCSVRQSAVDRVFGLGQKLSKLKSQNSNLKTVLTGCVIAKDKIKFKKIFDSVRKQPWFHSYAPSKYIPISSGCNNFCAYCVVPHTRGKLVCRNHEDIVKDVKNAAKNGVKEIWLLGQNVNDYEIKNQKSKIKINFAKLLKSVNDIPGDFSIRFTSPNPADFSDELIEVMAKCEKIAKYLNLPVQSGDDKILKIMNRRYTVEQYKNLVQKIRKKIPDINLSTDVIVGFPGETKKQFENTAKLFKEIKFNIAYISKYSPRQGTAAFRLKDNVPILEKKRREQCLRKLLL